MIKFREIVFITIVLLFVGMYGTGYVYGLSCYECSTSDGNQCLDKINKKVVKPVNCNISIFTQANYRNEDFICIFTKEQYPSQTTHIRRCGLKSEESICKTIKGETNESNLTSCFTCQTDLCNASANVGSNLLLLVFTLISCINLIKFNLQKYIW